MDKIERMIEQLLEQKLRVDDILNSYLYTALWTEELDAEYDVEDIDPLSKKEARRDIESFLSKAKSLLKSTNLDDSAIGHNFWLDRNGHGAGFWDLGLGKVGEDLSKISSSFGTAHMFEVGDGAVTIE